MSAAGKVAAVAAPEAKLAGVGRKPSPAGGAAARQRAQIDAIKARRPKPQDQDQEDEDQDQEQDQGPGRGRRAWEATKAAARDQTGSPGWWPSNAEPMKASNAGAGYVLGLFLWVGVRAYLEGGTLGVRQLLAAKFLNKTGPTK